MDTLSVEEVVTQQKQQRLDQQRKQLNRWLRLIFSHAIVLGFTLWLVFSPHFELHISLVNRGVLSNSSVKRLIDQPYYNKVYFAFSPFMFEEVIAHPLIKTIQINPYDVGKWEVYVTQHRPLALWDASNAILLESGQRYRLTQDDHTTFLAVPVLSGYEDEMSHRALSEALLSVEEGSFSLISEIIQEAKSYDLNYTHLIMQDGIHVYTSLQSFHVLNDYMAIKRALNPEHNCIVIDEITSVPYSFSCTP